MSFLTVAMSQPKHSPKPNKICQSNPQKSLAWLPAQRLVITHKSYCWTPWPFGPNGKTATMLSRRDKERGERFFRQASNLIHCRWFQGHFAVTVSSEEDVGHTQA